MKNLILLALFLFLPTFVEAKTVTVRYTIKTATDRTNSYNHANNKKTNVDLSVDKRRLPVGKYEALAEIPDSQEWQIIKRFKNAPLIAHIYKNESTFGRADICRTMGKANGFGYSEWPGHRPTCFSSFEEVASLVDKWIEEKLNHGLSLAQIGCLYIRGQAIENCHSDYKF